MEFADKQGYGLVTYRQEKTWRHRAKHAMIPAVWPANTTESHQKRMHMKHFHFVDDNAKHCKLESSTHAQCKFKWRLDTYVLRF